MKSPQVFTPAFPSALHHWISNGHITGATQHISWGGSFLFHDSPIYACCRKAYVGVAPVQPSLLRKGICLLPCSPIRKGNICMICPAAGHFIFLLSHLDNLLSDQLCILWKGYIWTLIQLLTVNKAWERTFITCAFPTYCYLSLIAKPTPKKIENIRKIYLSYIFKNLHQLPIVQITIN